MKKQIIMNFHQREWFFPPTYRLEISIISFMCQIMRQIHGLEKFREQIKTQFSLVAHIETRETPVLVLKLKNPAAAGLETVETRRTGFW